VFERLQEVGDGVTWAVQRRSVAGLYRLESQLLFNRRTTFAYEMSWTLPFGHKRLQWHALRMHIQTQHDGPQTSRALRHSPVTLFNATAE
jgi:hypothetical protein